MNIDDLQLNHYLIGYLQITVMSFIWFEYKISINIIFIIFWRHIHSLDQIPWLNFRINSIVFKNKSPHERFVQLFKTIDSSKININLMMPSDINDTEFATGVDVKTSNKPQCTLVELASILTMVDYEDMDIVLIK